MNLNHTRIGVLIDGHDYEANEIVKTKLLDIFNCEFQPQENRRKSKMTGKCSDSSPRVIKTIRVRFDTLKYWIQDTDIKVHFLSFDVIDCEMILKMLKIIHLVRDPRGILNSRENHNWRKRLRDIEYVCENLENDLQIVNLLPKER